MPSRYRYGCSHSMRRFRHASILANILLVEVPYRALGAYRVAQRASVMSIRLLNRFGKSPPDTSPSALPRPSSPAAERLMIAVSKVWRRSFGTFRLTSPRWSAACDHSCQPEYPAEPRLRLQRFGADKAGPPQHSASRSASPRPFHEPSHQMIPDPRLIDLDHLPHRLLRFCEQELGMLLAPRVNRRPH